MFCNGLYQGNRRHQQIFRSYRTGDVAFSRHIFEQNDLTRSHQKLLASRDLHLTFALEHQNVLAVCRIMPVLNLPAGQPEELYARRFERLRLFGEGVGGS